MNSAIMEALTPVPKIRLAIVEAASPVIQCVVVEKRSAVGFEAVVVKNNVVVMPVRSPVVPSPAKPAKETDAKS
jgi:7-keto-8-aminopelargonate synthetase-like enzyme